VRPTANHDAFAKDGKKERSENTKRTKGKKPEMGREKNCLWQLTSSKLGFWFRLKPEKDRGKNLMTQSRSTKLMVPPREIGRKYGRVGELWMGAPSSTPDTAF